MTSIPLTKKADLSEEVSDFFWDDADGPLENIFRWGGRFAMFTGGPLSSLAFMALTAAGIGPEDWGKYLDQTFGLSTFDDLSQINTDDLVSKSTEHIWSGLESAVGNQAEAAVGYALIVHADAPEPVPLPPLYGPKQRPAPVDLPPLAAPAGEEEKKKKIRQMDPETAALTRRRLEIQEETLRFRREQLEAQKNRGLNTDRELAEVRRSEQRLKKMLEDLKSTPAATSAPTPKPEDVSLDTKQQNRQKKFDEKEEWKRREQKLKFDEKWEKRRMKSLDKLRGMRVGSQPFMSGVGRTVLGLGVAGVIGKVFQSIGSPSSWLSKALRAAGIITAETVGDDDAPDSAPRERMSPSKPGKTTNYKARLEQRIDQILQ